MSSTDNIIQMHYNNIQNMYRDRKYSIISLEGNIGAGKSTLLEKLELHFAENPAIRFLREPVDVWEGVRDSDGETILQKFYKNPQKHAFTFQVMAYASRLSALTRLLKEHPECTVIICERSLDADKYIFAKMLHDDGAMDDVEYQIYQMFSAAQTSAMKLDGIVYLDTEPDACLSRVANRGRDGEEGISLDYLYRCREYHETWFSSESREASLLRLNTTLDASYAPGDVGSEWVMAVSRFVGNWTSRG
jgi:deoxyadenosine/deoxycytidine kinase